MNKTLETIKAFFFITIGAAIAAFSVEEFLSPNKIFDGGVIGISMILDNLFSYIPFSILVVIINLPFVVYAFKNFGKIFVAKAIYAMVVFAIAAEIFAPFTNATYDMLLATVFGGVILGVGVGLVLRHGGCLDGTEIVAISVNRKTNMSLGTIILAINVGIYSVAGLLFGLESALYSMIMYFITAKVIDIVEVGFDSAKAAMIITEEGKLIADEIYKNFGRTVTFIKGEGLVSNSQKDILYCVVTRAEINELRKLIKTLDVGAFITVNDVSEIIGTFVKSRPESES